MGLEQFCASSSEIVAGELGAYARRPVRGDWFVADHSFIPRDTPSWYDRNHMCNVATDYRPKWSAFP